MLWENWPAIVEAIGFIVVVGASAVWLKSTLVKQRASELAELAETRGDRIADLESEVHLLELRISKLEGAYQALQTIKATEIADEVVARLNKQ